MGCGPHLFAWVPGHSMCLPWLCFKTWEHISKGSFKNNSVCPKVSIKSFKDRWHGLVARCRHQTWSQCLSVPRWKRGFWVRCCAALQNECEINSVPQSSVVVQTGLLVVLGPWMTILRTHLIQLRPSMTSPSSPKLLECSPRCSPQRSPRVSPSPVATQDAAVPVAHPAKSAADMQREAWFSVLLLHYCDPTRHLLLMLSRYDMLWYEMILYYVL